MLLKDNIPRQFKIDYRFSTNESIESYVKANGSAFCYVTIVILLKLV